MDEKEALAQILDLSKATSKSVENLGRDVKLTNEEVQRMGRLQSDDHKMLMGIDAMVKDHNIVIEEWRAGVAITPADIAQSQGAPKTEPAKSITSEVRDSIRVNTDITKKTGEETAKQTPMLEQLLNGQQTAPARNGVATFVGNAFGAAIVFIMAAAYSQCQSRLAPSPSNQVQITVPAPAPSPTGSAR